MHEIKSRLQELKQVIKTGLNKINLPEKKKQLNELNEKMQDPNFWDDSDAAQEISQHASNLSKLIDTWESVSNEVEELLNLFPEISPERDPDSAEDFKQMVAALEEKWRTLEISTFLNGKYDEDNAILMIQAGTGGTDAQDFADMLMRMYMKYAEKNGFSLQLLDKSDGDEAGIKSATILIKGEFAYGYLKNEAGVHRLVRLSPFNSGNSRETSFALIEVLPDIKKKIAVDMHPDDLKIDVFRAGGHGGQSVNTTDSAVRITHLPTGITAQCQNERSQLQNKEHAMSVLQAKLIDQMEKAQAKELNDLKGCKTEVSWGNQIRSYVLHPYKMVKDHRTDYEENNPDSVLDGNLEGFIEAELKKI
ncbi:peptide chain release factor 2 [Candidatus Peregrinibacteria bacterium]|nr:peptide chain release factor 2 [Candidatus Peregrinibacteria bacterium]